MFTQQLQPNGKKEARKSYQVKIISNEMCCKQKEEIQKQNTKQKQKQQISKSIGNGLNLKKQLFYLVFKPPSFLNSCYSYQILVLS